MMTEKQLKEFERIPEYVEEDETHFLTEDIKKLVAEVRRLNAAYAQVKAKLESARGDLSFADSWWCYDALVDAFEDKQVIP